MEEAIRMRNVYIVGSYSSKFTKSPHLSHKDLVREAYLGALADSGIESVAEIESAWFGNCLMDMWGQQCIRGQVCFTPLIQEGLFPERIPIINVEGGCATASIAFQGAWKDVVSGQHHVSLAVGVEKLFIPNDREKMFRQYEAGIDQLDPGEWQATYERAGEVVGRPFRPEPDRTMFMDTYAMQALYHMQKYGTTQRQIAVGAAKNHTFGAHNEKAQYQFEMSVDDVLADRPVTFPLTRAMCAPVGDGAAAAILCSEEYLVNLPREARERAVLVAGCGMSSGKYRGFDEPSLSKVAADRAYLMAGITPGEIDVAEVHDATSFSEIYQAEMLGFCPIGEGGTLVESGETMLEGRIPINTSGGLVSKGHPVGATGLSMIDELVIQLRGEAGPRQVKNAGFALKENGGGVVGLEEAACSVVILKRT